MGTVRPKLGRPRKDGGNLSDTQKAIQEMIALPTDLYRPEKEVVRLKAQFQNRLSVRPLNKPPEEVTMRDIAKVVGVSSETVAQIIGKDLRALEYLLDRKTENEEIQYLWELCLQRAEKEILIGESKMLPNLMKILADVGRKTPDKSAKFQVDASQNRILAMDEQGLRSLIASRASELGLIEDGSTVDAEELRLDVEG